MDDAQIQNDVSQGISSGIEQLDSITGLDKEDHEAVWRSRTKMTWVALWSIILPTLYIILCVRSSDVLDKLGIMMSWYYLALASVVGAYYGFKTYATIKGK